MTTPKHCSLDGSSYTPVMLRTALLLALFLSPGCALAVGVAIGAGIVHTTSEDTVEATLERSTAEVFAAAESVLEGRGEVRATDADRLRIEGETDGAEVTMTIVAVDGERARIEVRARRLQGLSPDLETAKRVARAVVEKLS